MVQLAFLIQLYTNLGARPSEAVESEAWLGSNEGLHYQDFTLHHCTSGQYEVQYQIEVRLRNRKGWRKQVKEEYAARRSIPPDLSTMKPIKPQPPA